MTGVRSRLMGVWPVICFGGVLGLQHFGIDPLPGAAGAVLAAAGAVVFPLMLVGLTWGLVKAHRRGVWRRFQ